MQLRATIALRDKGLFLKTLVIMKLTALLLLTTALHVAAHRLLANSNPQGEKCAIGEGI